ncbi:MAG: glycine zipper family protein, partial [Synechococcaceae cyanobacterium]
GGCPGPPPPGALAQELFIYPAAGQSAEQQRKDRLECHLWATDQTGFDPTDPSQVSQASSAPAPQVQRQGPGTARSTARGAVIGTAGGAIAGNTGRGALVGATTGALVGAGRRVDQRRDQQQATEDWVRQQQADDAERQVLLQYRRQAFNRAVTACMEGRGYTVS